MEAQITIHEDYCREQRREEIQMILSAVTQVITEAVLRSIAA